MDAGTARLEEFAKWRDADLRHRVAFAQATEAWEAMERTRHADVDDARDRPAPSPRVSRRHLLRASGVVGTVLIAGSGAGALLFRGNRAYAATAVGEMQRFEAVPGLVIELNTDSRVAWAARGQTCDVWLERGEAALFVDERVLNGVTLRLGGDEIVLTPGAYATRRLGAVHEVLVLSGGARAAGVETAASTARTNQKLRLLRDQAPRPEAVPDIGAETAWRRGEIVFSSETLAQATEQYNRYLEHKLVISDPAVAAIRIGGRFETVRPEAFLAALEQSFDLVARPDEGQVRIERKSMRG